MVERLIHSGQGKGLFFFIIQKGSGRFQFDTPFAVGFDRVDDIFSGRRGLNIAIEENLAFTIGDDESSVGSRGSGVGKGFAGNHFNGLTQSDERTRPNLLNFQGSRGFVLKPKYSCERELRREQERGNNDQTQPSILASAEGSVDRC